MKISITEKDYPISNIEKVGADMTYVERRLFDLTEERKVPINVFENVTTFKNKDNLNYPWTTVFLRDRKSTRLNSSH